MDFYETIDAISDATLTMFEGVVAGDPPETAGSLARRVIDQRVQDTVANSDAHMLSALGLDRETALAKWRLEVELGRTLHGFIPWLQALFTKPREAA